MDQEVVEMVVLIITEQVQVQSTQEGVEVEAELLGQHLVFLLQLEDRADQV